MVIVKIHGGLGNQMFQYAFYKALEVSGKDVYADLRPYGFCKFHQGYELERIFGIKVKKADNKICENLGNDRYSLTYRIAKKIFNFKYNKNTHIRENEHFDKINDRFFFNIDNVFLEGFWQSEKYFLTTKEKLLKEFVFQSVEDINNKKMVEKINNSNSVSINIRRGDYLLPQNKCFANAIPREYYQKAIEFILERQENVLFFIFSDDIEWCKKNINNIPCVYVDINRDINSYKDMYLISCCKHNILANSTFNWWGAYLNNYSNKIVVAPPRWIVGNIIKMEDIIPSCWNIMEQ